MSTDAGAAPRYTRSRIEVYTRADGSRAVVDHYPRPHDVYSPNPIAAVERLRALASERAQIEGRITVTVQEVRQAGASWTVVGDALGVSRSAAQKRFGADELPLR